MDSVDQENPIQGRRQQVHHGSTEQCVGNDSSSSAIRRLKSAVTRNCRFLIPSCFRRPSSSGLPISLSPPAITVYQVWPGKNVFFLDGRVICGPDPRGLILTAIAVLLSERILLADVVDPSWKHPVLIAVFSIALAAAVIATLLLTATRDPGIVPRSRTSPPLEADTSAGTGTRSRRIVIDGVEMEQKYCRICENFRPPRSSHCAICDNCVNKFDHHCHWIGQCIGLRNYRLYLLLITLALAFYTHTLAFSVRRIRVQLGTAAGAGLLGLLRSWPEMVALAAFSSMAVWLLACLLVYHVFLATKNQTSHETHKGQYRSSHNPYDRGVLRNFRECLFEKLPPPRVDFRAVAQPNLIGSAATTLAFSQFTIHSGG
uniref:Uncharacterized protein n=1 Tax=Avena sativa TaxID=4498 RepID=A0ACD5UZQ4_AVESA